MTRDDRIDARDSAAAVAAREATIRRFASELAQPGGNVSFRPQFAFELAKKRLEILLFRYSCGDPVPTLASRFEPILEAWELAESLGRGVWTEAQQHTRHAWSVNLDHYIRCFWLVGLAQILEVPEPLWSRLIHLIGNEGQDALLDRVIATRQPGRRVGAALCQPRVYAGLWDAVQAPSPQQPEALAAFVAGWYTAFDRPPKKGLSRSTNVAERPYWYDNHLGQGAYFGYWCIEAAAAAKAFGVDDRLCLGLPHYPGDLLGTRAHAEPPNGTLPRQPFDPAAREVPARLADRLRKRFFDRHAR